MDRASGGMPFRDFAEPSDRTIHGDLVSIPSVTGLSLGEAMAALSSAGFTPVVGKGRSLQHPRGSGRGHPTRLQGPARQRGHGLHLGRGRANAHHRTDCADPETHETHETPRERLDAGTSVRAATQARR